MRNLGITHPIYTEKVSSDLEASMTITAPLVTIMILRQKTLCDQNPKHHQNMQTS